MLDKRSGSRLANLWDDAKAATMTEPERLVYRSNILGSDKRVTNYGGGNTSSKVWQADPLTGEFNGISAAFDIEGVPAFTSARGRTR